MKIEETSWKHSLAQPLESTRIPRIPSLNQRRIPSLPGAAAFPPAQLSGRPAKGRSPKTDRIDRPRIELYRERKRHMDAFDRLTGLPRDVPRSFNIELLITAVRSAHHAV